MSKFPRWGLSVLTMASVATVLLLVTGWGSAVAASISSVIVANTANNPAQVHEAGTANVNVTNTTAMPVNAKNLNTDTNGNLKVAEQGTPNVNVTNTTALPVSGSVTVSNLPGTQPVSGSVTVSNLPDAPKTVVIGSAGTVLNSGEQPVMVPVTDISAYREVTLYMEASSSGAGGHCYVTSPNSNGPGTFILDSFDTGTNTLITKTVDPAPPQIFLQCTNPTLQVIDLSWEMTGRTG